MRIHTDLHAYDVGQIVRDAKCGAWANVLTDHGTRTAKRGAVELQLAGTSNRPNASNTENAATWDEWGIVLAAIFEADPTAIMGSAKRPVYADRDDYHWKTGDRFRSLTSSSDDLYHANHYWRWDAGIMPRGESRCKCGAIRRWTAHAELVASA